MKAALFVLLSIAAALPTQAAFGNGYSFRRSITVDHTKVPNTDQTSFPVLVKGTYSYLATVANGGLVTNGSGFDIIFTSDLAGTTPLPYERELYTALDGTVIFWVNVPTVATAADTVIYEFYGNAAISTDQSNPTGTWNTGYAGVWHMPNGTTLTANDSTTNANNATTTTATGETGFIDGGALFTGSAGTAEITFPHTASLSPTSFTLEFWLNWGALGGDFEQVAFTNGFFFFTNGSNVAGLAINGDFASAAVWTGLANTWYHVQATYTDATKAVSVYVNGALINTRTTASNMAAITSAFDLGFQPTQQFLAGHLDEIRISNVVRSADWEATSYNSQNSPSTFYTVGSQTTSGTTAAATLILL